MPAEPSVLSWLHFGDLHITEAGEQNHRDFQALVDAANTHLAAAVDFAVLPGDNADNGTAAQFRLVREAADRLDLPLNILPGDHDIESGTLDDFHSVLGADRLPKAAMVAGHCCLFLDIVSAGTGGPDFRLDERQCDWLADELERTDGDTNRPVIFMHGYPADLRMGGERLRELLARHQVACVDMGHTHYNELANDGRTIYAAARSTGQIEEGPVGFALAAVDGGVVSWRFQELAEPWPVVMITRPADHRLITDGNSYDQVLRGPVTVRAKVWSGRETRQAVCRFGDETEIAMQRFESDTSLWTCLTDPTGLGDGLHRLTVSAEDSSGATGQETVMIRVSATGRYDAPARRADGSDRDALGAWPEKGILGTQLGPNRNGRKW